MPAPWCYNGGMNNAETSSDNFPNGNADDASLNRSAAAMLHECYADMRRIARRLVIDVGGDLQLQATDLAHEAAIRLIRSSATRVADREHMLALCARTMRQALIGELRRVRASKRQAPRLITMWPGEARRLVDLDVLDDALKRLGDVSVEYARIVELRFSLGLSVEETALLTGLPARTVKRRWSAARAWLRKDLEADAGAEPIRV